MTRVLVVLVAVLASSSAVAKEAFDAARFVAPPRWQKSQSPGVIRLTAPAARGSAGEIFLFASEPSRGTPEQNFQAAWQKLIATPLGGLAPAQTSTETTSEGWIAVSGVAQYVRQGATWRAVLITATGAGRSMSFVVQVLGQAHDAEVDTFFKELDLVPAEGAPVAAAVPAAASGPSAMASGLSAEAGGMTYTPPRGWNRTTRADAVVYVSQPYPNTREVCELLILPMRKGSTKPRRSSAPRRERPSARPSPSRPPKSETDRAPPGRGAPEIFVVRVSFGSIRPPDDARPAMGNQDGIRPGHYRSDSAAKEPRKPASVGSLRGALTLVRKAGRLARGVV